MNITKLFAINPESLGHDEFKKSYGLKYAYVAGAMYKGIASPALVIKLGQAGLLGFLGTGGMRLAQIESAIQTIQQVLTPKQAYGMNLLCNLIKPALEDATVALFLKYNIVNIEAVAFMQITPSLVWFRLKGLHYNAEGQLVIPHRVIAKVSCPEVAQVFMSPAPPAIVRSLVEQGKVTAFEAELSQYIPMAHDICVEADSGGHTDQGVAFALLPAMLTLRDKMMSQYRYRTVIRIGAAGGIGTPQAAAAAFMLGADFIVTGSINQCTVEAGTSAAVKDILQEINIQDTTYAPAGDMFEIGAKVQVVRKGLFFAARSNKLLELYRQYNSLEEIDEKTSQQIQEKYFKKNFEQVWEETKAYYLKENMQDIIIKAEQNPKRKMALIFRRYFVYTTRLALKGIPDEQVNYQIQCGPALGAFNQWVNDIALKCWRNRHVDQIAEKLMMETSHLLSQRYQAWFEQENNIAIEFSKNPLT